MESGPNIFKKIIALPKNFEGSKMKCPMPACGDAQMIDIRSSNTEHSPLKKTTFCPMCRTQFTIKEMDDFKTPE